MECEKMKKEYCGKGISAFGSFVLVALNLRLIVYDMHDVMENKGWKELSRILRILACGEYEDIKAHIRFLKGNQL